LPTTRWAYDVSLGRARYVVVDELLRRLAAPDQLPALMPIMEEVKGWQLVLTKGQYTVYERPAAGGCTGVMSSNISNAHNTSQDTIAAIATPPGIGGIGIVRISGPEAFAVGHVIFRAAGAGRETPPSHLLTYGHAVDPATGERLDEVLAAFMQAPRTYTCE